MPRKVPVSAVVVAAAVVLFLWDVLFAGQTFYLRDVIFDALPWRRFCAAAVAHGEIPLWNPHSRFGQPFLANPQSAVLYPPHLLFAVLPAGWAVKLNLLGHLLLGGTSMAALLRRFRLHHAAAALGGIVWALGAYMTANLDFMSVMETLAWCPLTVLLAVRVVDAGDAPRPLRAHVVRAAALSTAIAVQFLAGQVQPLAFTVLIAAGFAAAAARDGDAPSWARARSAAVAVVLAVVFAAGLTAVQWMPTRELLPLSIRASGVDAGLGIASAHPRHLLHLLDPFASGRPGFDAWHGGTLFEFWLGAIYVGLLPLALAAAALVARPRAGTFPALRTTCAVTLLCGLVLALGQHTPVYGLLLEWVPGFDLFRWPAKAFQLVVFALTVLAATGLDGLLARRDRVDSPRLDPALIAATVVATAAAVRPVDEYSGAGRVFVFAVLAAAAIATLRTKRVPVRAALAAALALVLADLYGVSREIQLVDDDAILEALPANVPDLKGGRVYTPYTTAQYQLYGSRDPKEWALAVDLLAGDVGVGAGIDRTYGGDALQVARTCAATDPLETAPDDQWSRMMQVMGVTAVLAGPPFHELRLGAAPPRWLHPSGSVPRAYVVGEWRPAPDDVRSLLAPDFDPLLTALVDDSLPAVAGPAGARIVATEYRRESVDIDVDVRAPSLLVVADTWFPGWVARVDGRARDIVRVNTMFRGVLLEPGDREVRMTYEPRSFRSGVTWTAFSALALLALLTAVALPRRRGDVSAG